MKLLFALTAFLAVCYADVGERGYQYPRPSNLYQTGVERPTNVVKPSAPLRDESVQGVFGGVHTSQETHGSHQSEQGSHLVGGSNGVHGSHDVQVPHNFQGSEGSQGSGFGGIPQVSVVQRPQLPHQNLPSRPQVPQVVVGSQPGPASIPARPSFPVTQQDPTTLPVPFPGGGPLVIRPQAPNNQFGSQGNVGNAGVGGVSSVGGTSSVPGWQEGDSDDGSYYGGDLSAIPGESGKDYPNYSTFPKTTFSCAAQKFPGYYADVETNCQGFHICNNGHMYDFLCPLGTIFHQEYFVCVWWFQFDCSTAQSLYSLNELLYVTPARPANVQQNFPSGTTGSAGFSGSVSSSGSVGSSGSVASGGSGVSGSFGSLPVNTGSQPVRPGGSRVPANRPTFTQPQFDAPGGTGSYGNHPGRPSRPQVVVSDTISQGQQNTQPHPSHTSPVRPPSSQNLPYRPHDGQQSEVESNFPISSGQVNHQGHYPSNQQQVNYPSIQQVGNYPSNQQQVNYPSNQADFVGDNVQGQGQQVGQQQYPGATYTEDASLKRPNQQVNVPSHGYLPPSKFRA